jgi:hypothetical protein
MYAAKAPNVSYPATNVAWVVADAPGKLLEVQVC